MNFCQYCNATVDYGFICDDCRLGVNCQDKDNLCEACKKFVAERIAQVENEARESSRLASKGKLKLSIPWTRPVQNPWKTFTP